MGINDLTNAIYRVHHFLFRNDCGAGYVGGDKGRAVQDQALTLVNKKGESKTFYIKRGDLVIIRPSFITYGLQPGSGDFIGWEPVIITPAMVGTQKAIFTSCEAKTENDTLKPDQLNWHKRILAAGGISEIWKEKKGVIQRE